MRKKLLKRIAIYALVFFSAYLLIGHLCHRVFFPENKPEVTTYFQPGQQFYSKSEGFRQIVSKQENGHVHGTLVVEPFALGPPKHIHSEFDETFQIENGELSVWMDGVVKKINQTKLDLAANIFLKPATKHYKDYKLIILTSFFAIGQIKMYLLKKWYGA